MNQWSDLDALQDLESPKKNNWKHHLKPLEHGGAVKIFPQTMSELIDEWIN